MRAVTQKTSAHKAMVNFFFVFDKLHNGRRSLNLKSWKLFFFVFLFFGGSRNKLSCRGDRTCATSDTVRCRSETNPLRYVPHKAMVNYYKPRRELFLAKAFNTSILIKLRFSITSTSSYLNS
jgi:hypothetical protein